MDSFIIDYENELKNKAFELLDDCFNKCSVELLYLTQNKVKFFVPSYFFNLISNDKKFKYRGYDVSIGYENAIIIFNEEYGFISNKIFRYKL